MLTEPVDCSTLVTNSVKCAHDAPGLVIGRYASATAPRQGTKPPAFCEARCGLTGIAGDLNLMVRARGVLPGCRVGTNLSFDVASLSRHGQQRSAFAGLPRKLLHHVDVHGGGPRLKASVCAALSGRGHGFRLTLRAII